MFTLPVSLAARQQPHAWDTHPDLGEIR